MILPNGPVVYAIRNLVNGKRYIGSTAAMKGRKAKHLADLRAKRHHSSILQHAYDKYGEQSFVFEVIETVAEVTNLLTREQAYLDECKPEYNISPNANEKTRLGMKATSEHSAHMSASLRGRVSPMKGKHLSEEHRRKIGEASKNQAKRTGWHHSASAIQKMSKARKDNPARPHTLSQNQKISDGCKMAYSRLSSREKIELNRKRQSARKVLPDKHGMCAICSTSFTYKPMGKSRVKTCGGAKCLSELRRRNLATRRKLDPDIDIRASWKRWQPDIEYDEKPTKPTDEEG